MWFFMYSGHDPGYWPGVCAVGLQRGIRPHGSSRSHGRGGLEAISAAGGHLRLPCEDDGRSVTSKLKMPPHSCTRHELAMLR